MLHNRRHVLARAPMRVSFVGGGTDFPDFWQRGRPGHVVAMAVDLFCYVNLKDMFDANVRVHHARIETESTASRIVHPYARTALEAYGLFRGVETMLTSDVMTTGSGLGASSSMMASLICAARGLRDEPALSQQDLASETFRLENAAGTVGGLQDQYSTCFGGFNSITFDDDAVTVRPLELSDDAKQALSERVFLVYTNLSRTQNELQQIHRDSITAEQRSSYLDQLLDLSHDFLHELEKPSIDFGTLGRILDESWSRKREFNHAVTNQYIDQLYEMLRENGVVGGKLLGAGGGGFLLVIAEEGAKQSIMYKLYPNFIALDIRPTDEHAKIVWKNF